ncbi:DUF397 domain-containing protein [Streptomyces sp. NBC_01230]|uniref:DUF397 domain-containing protein n=1 Tax=Streptomyces sp. NBC_01230 TaxID=2903784 RepID=UPI002E0DBBFB|nr:DUF397 domain-containing protein [Streptomyces sp. NBC_01230]
MRSVAPSLKERARRKRPARPAPVQRGGECVEVAGASDAVLVSDSQDLGRTALAMGSLSWSRFLGFVTQT